MSVQVNLFKLALVTFVAVSLVVFGDTAGKLLTAQGVAAVGLDMRSLQDFYICMSKPNCIYAVRNLLVKCAITSSVIFLPSGSLMGRITAPFSSCGSTIVEFTSLITPKFSRCFNFL